MKLIKPLLIVFAILFCGISYGQNEKYKALFIYNFTNYVDWPGNSSGSFVITILGNSSVGTELESFAKTKKINNKAIEIRRVTLVEEIGLPNIIFIPSNRKKDLQEISQKFKDQPVLIISDNASSHFGINFINTESKMAFQISRTNIEAHRLKVSNALLSLGTEVN